MSQPDRPTTSPDLDERDLRTRIRLLVVLFLSAALNRTGFIAVFTVTALAAEDILGSARWSGLAAAFGTLGLAVGTTPMAAMMARRGRRPGLVVGLSVAVVGAAVSAYGVRSASFLLLLGGLFLFGFGNSADRMSRYAAADIAPVAIRSSAIAAVVWAGTVGSVLGPVLLPLGSRLVEPFGFSEYAGGYLIGGVLAASAMVLVLVALRPDPLQLAGVIKSPDEGRGAPLRPLLRSPIVRYAVASLVIGQAAMVLLMSMTPVHIRRAGEGLALVGLVIGVHTFGMFFFSPVSGYLADRFGKIRLIVIGQVLLIVAALMASLAAGDDRALLLPALFLLGLGWNFGFVAGSSLITDAAEGATRIRLQGFSDTIMWMSGAVASVLSGIILEWIQFSGLALVGAALVAYPLYLRYRLGVSESPSSL